MSTFTVHTLDAPARGPYASRADARRELLALSKPAALAEDGRVIQWHPLATDAGHRVRLTRKARDERPVAAPPKPTPAPEEPTVTETPASDAAPTCAHPGCTRPRGRQQTNTRPEHAPLCAEHRRDARNAARPGPSVRAKDTGKSTGKRTAKSTDKPAPTDSLTVLSRAIEAVELVEAIGWPLARQLAERCRGLR